MGIDASGNRLDAAMPHFAMSRADAEDLVAYLKKLSTDHDPGIADGSVRVGVLLPPDDALAGQGAAIRSALGAYFKDWNGRGGVYGRRVELVFGQLSPESGKAAAFAEFLGREPVFALLSSFIAGAETEIVTLLGQRKIPLIGARTLLPPAADNPTVFFLDSGLRGQVEALAAYALRNYAADGPKPAVIASDDALSLAGVSALRAKLANSRWADPEQVSAPHDAAAANQVTRRLAAKQVRVAFPLMRASDLRLLMDSSQRIGWKPAFLVPGALSTADTAALQSAAGPLVLAYPFSPLDISQDAQAEWNRLADDHLVETRPMATQLTALCEARILIEGLRRAGRDLSRERLLESLDGLYDFPCGFKQPVSFGPGRRFGMEQVHVVVLSKGDR
jgi:ABC-type branched-subunit amino acid transport system substrate-binding protein